jgi:hypothetical protein
MKLDLMRTRRGVNQPRDAINSFENIWTNWMELAATIDWAIQDSVKHLPLWKSVDPRA